VDAKFGPIRNATNPDLTAFKQHGGKLIVYHGWNDPAVAPLNSVNYYLNVASTMGQKSADNVIRLYMVPGMQHCGDGPGTSDFGAGPKAGADAHHSLLVALEDWVEKGVGPDAIIATKYNTSGSPASGWRARAPVLIRRWLTTRDRATTAAANFVCKTP
jgi:feruloyl esterase